MQNYKVYFLRKGQHSTLPPVTSVTLQADSVDGAAQLARNIMCDTLGVLSHQLYTLGEVVNEGVAA